MATKFISFLFLKNLPTTNYDQNTLCACVSCDIHCTLSLNILLGSLVVDSRKNAYSGEEGTAERTAEKRS